LVRAHQGAVRNFLRRLTRETALADDLAQISFLKAYEQQHNLRDTKAAKSWLFQIAYRSFVDYYRKEARRRGLSDAHIEGDSSQAPASLKMDIEAAMNTLPTECHSEAAAATQLPLGTVKSHVLRGKEKLKAFLSAYETVK